MSALSGRVAHHVVLVVCLLVSLAVSGCSRLAARRPTGLSLRNPAAAEHDPNAAEQQLNAAEHDRPPSTATAPGRPIQRATFPGNRAVLARDDWIQAARPIGQAGGEPTYRWRFPDLEDLLARPAGARPDFRAALDDADSIVTTNAAISLARLGDASGREPLARAVRTPEMKLPMRLAAAEALATLRRPSAVELLRELIDQYGRPKRDGVSQPIPELHAELIRGLARHVDPADDRRFVQALGSRAADVRREALQAWIAGRRGTLPIEVADLRTDPDPRVRAAALGCLARRRHPEALPYLAAALEDHDFGVRVAAVAVLGELGGADAQARLRELLEDRAERIRAAAVSALAASGVDPASTGAAADKSWRVRLEAARALARYPTREGVALAGDLIDDPCSMVRRQVVASLAEWPLRRAGPVLLAAMTSSGYLTRQAAAGHLAALWPPAGEFPVHGPPERRAEVLQRLERRLRQEIGLVDPEVLAAVAAGDSAPPVSPEKMAQVEPWVRNLSDPGLPEPLRQWSIASLAHFGPGLVQALEQLALNRCQTLPEAVYRHVLPGYDRAFVVLDRLASADVAIRRRAAEELIEMTKERPLGRLAAARLASLVLSETDSLVWQRVLTAVVLDPSEPAVRLAYAAISHPSPDVRRRACEHLATHPDPDGRHVNVLLPALEDEDASVVLAAVRALGVSGPVIDTQPLRRLLISRNESLRVEVAITLARLGDPAGPAALERLAYSNDEAVRRRVAVAMGEIGDASFIPSLVRLLDDHHSIRLAALESLPQVVGRDVTETEQPSPRSLAERLDCWKRWFARQHGTIALRPPGNGATESIDRLSPGPR